MTKEEFLRALKSDDTWDEIEYSFNKFFEQNICIPKGENPHPCADVLHKWIEGAEMEWHSVDLDKNKATINTWYSVEGGISIRLPFDDYVQYRIKPSEPIYEWQWYYVTPDKTIRIEENFMAESETAKPWVKFEETKRIRQ